MSGCGYANSTFNPHGPAAHSIASLAWFMTILFLFIIVVMWALLAFAFYKRRGTLAEHAPIDAGGGQMWIAIGGIAIPLIVLTILFVLGLGLLRDFPIHGMHGGMNQRQMAMMMKPEIRIIGHQWWWEIQYLNDDPSQSFTTANELHLPTGRSVNIEVETADVMHSFWVPALHGKVDLIPGQPNYIRIEASSPGEYTGQCAEYCGAQHAKMRMLAVAQQPDEYELWRQSQLKEGIEPSAPAAKQGQQIFLSGPCSMCHTVRGTIAGEPSRPGSHAYW
jgi:cytochrome c oxidase subunit 2